MRATSVRGGGGIGGVTNCTSDEEEERRINRSGNKNMLNR